MSRGQSLIKLTLPLVESGMRRLSETIGPLKTDHS